MSTARSHLYSSAMTRLSTVTLVFTLVFAPLAVLAQAPTRSVRVGFVTGVTPPAYVQAFRDGLRQHGWVEGQNLTFDLRSADGDYDRVAALVAEVVARKPDVILLTSTSAQVAKRMVGATPVVFVIADDPVRAGLVASLARPGGRATGLTSLNVELDAKRLEILKQALPGVRRVGVLTTPEDTAHRERLVTIESAAKALALQLHLMPVSRPDDVPRAFEAATRAQVGAVMLLGAPPLLRHQARILELATKARLPLISAWSEFADSGGLMTYGTNVPAMFRHAAAVADRILRGANPAEIPVERATTFELVINRKTAQALRIDIPAAVMLRADRMIE
jgi:putative tryptophan/tyrosine transport system substrate-binding protein